LLKKLQLKNSLDLKKSKRDSRDAEMYPCYFFNISTFK